MSLRCLHFSGATRHNFSWWILPTCSTTTHLHVLRDLMYKAKGSLPTTPLFLLVQSCLECLINPSILPGKCLFVFKAAQMSPPLKKKLSYALQAGELSGLHTSAIAFIKFYFQQLSA